MSQFKVGDRVVLYPDNMALPGKITEVLDYVLRVVADNNWEAYHYKYSTISEHVYNSPLYKALS